MFELRVLDGEQQGIALPLIGKSWSIGDNDDHDLALTNDACKQGCKYIKRIDQQWFLDEQPLTVDTIFHLGTVQLVISHVTSAWQVIEPESAPLAATSQQSDINSQAASDTIVRSNSSNKQALMIFGLLIITLSGWAVSIPSSISSVPQTPAAIQQNSNQEPQLEIAKVTEILNHMLKERELTAVTVETDQNQITLTGSLIKQQELDRLARMISKFERQFNSPLSIINKVEKVQYSLPFRIAQITTGPTPHIVTATGHKVFVGDEVQGVRLVAIHHDRLAFGGKFALELPW